ncbi:ABC transporter substrate-binding protein [Sansalvadorimonas sp. 2012CJ34-2]|uniref:ABC transporter substrate-binding protein n=1 Tax=Parendozoicomonas callyspongiae TaxID=2942213 RepID=A0ABT0PHP2_9GAMM|nr:ABC transporter substrate-binding protein [Sansalvadorimonas sp. 2012CJ34-2]MCL6270905.1 ABC transporter substrate-binding protein [Sansalvadorimonas sp. 2012CJ34-2]
MKTKTLFASLALAAAVSAALPTQAADVPAGVKLDDVQVLNRGNGSEPASLDPQKIEGVPGGNVAKDMFEGLMSQDGDGNTVFGVAKSYDVSEDGKVYTFHLRDAKWSNGDPVAANDFVFAFQRAVDPATASNYAWFMELPGIINASEIIKGEKPANTLGVKALDAKTFQVSLKAPLPFFPKLLAHQTTFPVPQKIVEKYGDQWTRPENIVSNGAFVLDEWVVNERISLKPNPNYWNADETVLKQVNFLPIVSQTADLSRYKAGEVDMTYEIPIEHFKSLKKELPDDVTVIPYVGTYYYVFNTLKAPFNDVRVRKALTYSINRDAIAYAVKGQGEKPAYAFTPEAINGFVKPDLAWEKMTQKERDAEAKRLLKEVGYDKNNPLKVELLYNTSESHKKIAIAIGQMWKRNLGVEVTLRNEEWKTFLDSKRNNNFDVSRAGWIGDYNEASTMLGLWTSYNAVNDADWKNPEYDKLIETAATTLDEGQRGLIYEKAEKIFSEEFPAAPIYQYVVSRMVKPYVGGYPYGNAEDNVYSKDLYIIKH